METEEVEKRYRCRWCQYVMNEHMVFVNKEEQDKYKNENLPTTYCKECYEIIMKEHDF